MDTHTSARTFLRHRDSAYGADHASHLFLLSTLKTHHALNIENVPHTSDRSPPSDLDHLDDNICLGMIHCAGSVCI